MKLAMKLRTRLFLSISALITVALLGLMLGLVSVMQMAETQEVAGPQQLRHPGPGPQTAPDPGRSIDHDAQ